MNRKLHGMRTVLGALALVALMSATSQAGLCDTLFGWCGLSSKSEQVTYMPPIAPAAGACATTCTYVPQTAYRTVYRSVPVTSYQPVAATDACTGCPTTTLRPVVTYQRQPQLIPYRSYRLVYSNPIVSGCNPCATSACSPCATGGSSCASGACGGAPSAGCTSCAGGAPSISSPTYEPANGTMKTPPTETYRPAAEPEVAPINSTPASMKSTIDLTPSFTPPLQSPVGRTTMRPVSHTKPITDKYGWRHEE